MVGPDRPDASAAAGRPGPAKPPVFALWNPWASGWLTDAQHIVYAFGSSDAAEEFQDGEKNEVVELVPAAAADAARAALVERDKFISGLVAEAWRQPPRTLASVDDSGVIEHGWEWRFGVACGFERTKEAAIEAVRFAAGLAPGGGAGAGREGGGR